MNISNKVDKNTELFTAWLGLAWLGLAWLANYIPLFTPSDKKILNMTVTLSLLLYIRIRI